MKKILIFLSVFFLISCENDIQTASEISYSLEPLEVSAEPLKEEVTTDLFHIHDPFMPNYVTLESYPNEVVIDWDTKTYQNYSTGQQLVFDFKKEELLKTIEIESYNLKYIKLIFNNNRDKVVRIQEGFNQIEVERESTDHDRPDRG